MIRTLALVPLLWLAGCTGPRSLWNPLTWLNPATPEDVGGGGPGSDPTYWMFQYMPLVWTLVIVVGVVRVLQQRYLSGAVTIGFGIVGGVTMAFVVKLLQSPWLLAIVALVVILFIWQSKGAVPWIRQRYSQLKARRGATSSTATSGEEPQSSSQP